jgi:hypothetical protein
MTVLGHRIEVLDRPTARLCPTELDVAGVGHRAEVARHGRSLSGVVVAEPARAQVTGVSNAIEDRHARWVREIAKELGGPLCIHRRAGYASTPSQQRMFESARQLRNLRADGAAWRYALASPNCSDERQWGGPLARRDGRSDHATSLWPRHPRGRRQVGCELRRMGACPWPTTDPDRSGEFGASAYRARPMVRWRPMRRSHSCDLARDDRVVR